MTTILRSTNQALLDALQNACSNLALPEGGTTTDLVEVKKHTNDNVWFLDVAELRRHSNGVRVANNSRISTGRSRDGMVEENLTKEQMITQGYIEEEGGAA